MSTKDYERIAAVVKAELSERFIGGLGRDKWASYCLRNFVVKLCHELKLDNPAFDRVKFIEACGLPVTRDGIVLYD